MNLPNKLTVLRVCMIPFFVVMLLLNGGENQTYRYIAAAIFIVASLTDMLDGKIARKYNLVTNFGKFMDPLADQAVSMFRTDLSGGFKAASSLDGDRDHQPGIYHQRIPSGGFRQWNRHCSQLLGQI